MMNVYNGAAYVRDALESVRAQTFPDWEIVFWDNGSTDATGQIAAEFADPRMRYFRPQQATSPARARELAIREARGEWLAFVDHDDVWLPDKLASQLALAGDDPGVAIIYGRAVSLGSRGEEVDFDHRREFGALLQGDIFVALYTDSCFIQMSSVLLRRSAVAEVGGIPDSIEVISDYYLYLELTRRYKARALQGVVSRYRLRAGSLTHTAELRMHVEALQSVDRWAHEVDPKLVSIRRRNQATRLAVAELRHPGFRMAGLARLAKEGSVVFLLTRPPVWLYREVRRLLRRPIWRQDRAPTVWRGAPARIADSSLALSVIVVDAKGREALRDCLQSLRGQMRLATQAWEVVVVDTDAAYGSAEMVRAEFPEARLVAGQENFASAGNETYRSCRGRYVLLLDSGTVVLDHAVDRMLEIMAARPEVGALGCRLVGPDGVPLRWSSGNVPMLRSVASHFLLLYRVLPEAILPPPLYLENQPSADVEVGWVSSACMLVRREALGATLLFDERFGDGGEDFDLCDRLRLGEWKVLFTPAARAIHREAGGSARGALDAQRRRMRSLRVAFGMHNRTALLPVYNLTVLLGFLVRTVVYGLGALLRPGRGYSARASDSRRGAAESFASLFGR